MFEGTSAIRIVLHICNPLKDEPTINIIFFPLFMYLQLFGFHAWAKGTSEESLLK